ncbi:MAG TPA: S53 family peptidase [Solirubrobacteraceae bacterium]|nr:S53 family peptidase [Solirubrobacteraceae bacterium]
MRHALSLVAVALAVLTSGAGSAAASSTKVDFGDISHKGLKNLGPASTSLKLSLELGMIANQQGIANAVKAASNPTSSSYGKYLSLSTLQKKYGASSSRRNAVVGAFKNYGVKATVDVTHLRVSATVSVKTAQKLFGTKWDVYATGQKNQGVAVPVNTPKLVKGLSGNIDTVSGLRLNVTIHHAIATSSAARRPQAREAAVAGGTPTRTGTISPGCATTTYPGAVFSTAGLFPNQTLGAYGIASLQGGGLQGEGVRVAILGEAPTPTGDVSAFRNCFGFAGTALKIHGASNIAPILESSLDAMTIAMVAPKLARLDLWVKALGQADPQGALELLADPLQATTNGTPLPNVISISYGVCEASVKQYSAARTLFDRQLAATDALGITTVVAAGDSGSSSCAHGVPSSQLTSFDKQKSASWPATSPWVMAAGGTSLTLTPANTIESSGVWNDTEYPRPYEQTAAGGGGVSTFEKRPWWQPAIPSQKTYRMVPDVAAFADPSPGYVIICSPSVQGCAHSPGQTIAFVGGTSAAAPLVAGMIALWDQQARQSGLPNPGFVPPLLYSIAHRSPGSFLDITTGSNAIFGGVSCCTAGPGFDLASGLGSPLADLIVNQLHR